MFCLTKIIRFSPPLVVVFRCSPGDTYNVCVFDSVFYMSFTLVSGCIVVYICIALNVTNSDAKVLNMFKVRVSQG